MGMQEVWGLDRAWGTCEVCREGDLGLVRGRQGSMQPEERECERCGI